MHMPGVLRCGREIGGFMPRDGIEREFKAMLADSGERDRLLALIGGSVRVLAQRNVLFDTRSRALAAAGLSLRLRHEDDAWLLTAKGMAGCESSGGPALLYARCEAECMVGHDLALHLAAGTADPLPPLRAAEPAAMAHALARAIEEAAAGEPILVLGEFRNERTLCATALPCGMPVTVASVEHELELEIADTAIPPVSAWLEGLLEAAHIPIRPAQSKRQRFDRAIARREAPEARR
jgi:uncharacterized protein YjbK